MTTTSEDEMPEVRETPAADAPSAPPPGKPRTKPRKLSTTDKLRDLRESAARRVELLLARADRLRGELASVVKRLNHARVELERLDATLPAHEPPAEVPVHRVVNLEPLPAYPNGADAAAVEDA